MKKTILCLMLALTTQAISIEVGEVPTETVPELKEADRNICVVNHGATFTRFDRCRTNEVMIGIQNVNPITIRCAQLVINCRGSEDYQK